MGCFRNFLSAWCSLGGPHQSPPPSYTRLPQTSENTIPIRFPPGWNAIGCQESRYPTPQRLAQNYYAASRGRRATRRKAIPRSRAPVNGRVPLPEVFPERVAASSPLLPPPQQPPLRTSAPVRPSVSVSTPASRAPARERRRRRRETDHHQRQDGPFEANIEGRHGSRAVSIRNNEPFINIEGTSGSTRFDYRNADVLYRPRSFRNETSNLAETVQQRERRNRLQLRRITRENTNANARTLDATPVPSVRRNFTTPQPPPAPPASYSSHANILQAHPSITHTPFADAPLQDPWFLPKPMRTQQYHLPKPIPEPLVTSLHPILLQTSPTHHSLSWDITYSIPYRSSFDEEAMVPHFRESLTLHPFPSEWEPRWGAIYVRAWRNAHFVTVWDVLQAVYEYYHTSLTQSDVEVLRRDGSMDQVERAYLARLNAGVGRGWRCRVDVLGGMVVFAGVGMNRSGGGELAVELRYRSRS
ncbi:hypothetical protein PQX77_020033 [Marasmius sp. AFHP31]|nr:hypothetical protein PQX77_020033 [Marasmius sp. AFHP31]